MKNFARMFLYELKMTLREREAIFWMFLFPIALMLILGFVFGSSGNIKLAVGVVDNDGSDVSRAIVEAFSGVDALEVTEGTEEDERARMRDDDRNAVLIIPEGFERAGDAGGDGRAGHDRQPVGRHRGADNLLHPAGHHRQDRQGVWSAFPNWSPWRRRGRRTSRTSATSTSWCRAWCPWC